MSRDAHNAVVATDCFFCLLYTGRDLALICERFIFSRINLVLPKNRERRFDVEFLVPNFPSRHGC